MSASQLRHAGVAGASMAGLLAARVLADHFNHVTLIEKDVIAREPTPRKGVTQGRHDDPGLFAAHAGQYAVDPQRIVEGCTGRFSAARLDYLSGLRKADRL